MNSSNPNGLLLEKHHTHRPETTREVSRAGTAWAAGFGRGEERTVPLQIQGRRPPPFSVKFQKLADASRVRNYYINNLETWSDVSEACQQFHPNQAPGQDIHKKGFGRSYSEEDVLTANGFLHLRKNVYTHPREKRPGTRRPS